MRSYTNLQTETTIAAGISAAATTITLAHYWWNYPTANFTVTLSDQDATPNQEVVLIESRSGNTLTVAERGWDGTTAKAFDSGDAIECVVVAADFRHLNTNYIGHTTLTSSATSISVSSIPAGYEALRVVFSLQSDRAANALDGAIVQVGNGTVDTGANYSYYMHEYDISTSSSTNVEDHGADTSWRVSRFSTPAALQTSLFGSGELIIHGYADAQGPSARWHTGVPGTDPRESIGWGAWNDTTNAIDIITFKPHTGTNFVAGSEVTVYGVNSALELDGFSGASVTRSGDTIGTASVEAIVFSSAADYDTDSYHSTTTNNTRLTAPADGKYLVTASATWDSNATGARIFWLKRDGTTNLGGDQLTGIGDAPQNASAVIDMTAGEYVEAYAYQSSGGDRTITAFFTMSRLHSSGAVKIDDLTDVDTTTTTPSTGHVLRHNGTDWVPHSLGTTLIEEVTLSADGTITFSNIPDHYEDLLIVGRSRTSTAVNTGSLTMRVGSGTVDSGSTSYRYGCAYFLSGSTADGFLNSAGAAYGIAAMHIGGNATAGMFSAVEIRIHNYANTDYNRSWLGTSSGYGDSAASGSITSTSGGEWIDTTDPIDIIELSAEDGATDLEAGSRFALYGVSTAGASTSFSGARVRLTADEVIGTGSTVDVDWDEADFDTDTYWEGVTNPERLTVPADGYYYFTANARWDGNATGVRAISLRVNGTDVEFGTEIDGAAGAGDWLGQNTGGPLRLSAGDYVTCRVYQNSGGDLNVDYTTYTDFSVVRLHSSGAVKIDDLTDVDMVTTAPATGDLMEFDGTDWVPIESQALGYSTVGTANSDKSSSSLTLTKPTGTAEDDLMIILCATRNSVPNASGPDGDSSWTELYYIDTSTSEYHAAWYKVAGASEGSSYTLTASSTLNVAAIATFRGVSTLKASGYTFRGKVTPAIQGARAGLALVMFTGNYNGSTMSVSHDSSLTVAKADRITSDPQLVLAYTPTLSNHWPAPTHYVTTTEADQYVVSAQVVFS